MGCLINGDLFQFNKTKHVKVDWWMIEHGNRYCLRSDLGNGRFFFCNLIVSLIKNIAWIA